MSDRRGRTSTPARRRLALLTTIALLGTLLAVIPTAATVAAAAETVVFENTFRNSTVDGTGTVTTPTSSSGRNSACLTAGDDTSTAPLLSCPGITDAPGDGTLRLTETGGNQLGAVFARNTVPSTSGLEVSFNSYQYGGNGADGIGFVLAAVDPDSPDPPTATGPYGGSLGYATSGGTAGMPNGYLGVGLDVFGNYSVGGVGGNGCDNPATISAFAPGSIVVRGPGSGTTGYCGLATTYDGTPGSQLTLRSSSRAAAVVPVRVLINPTAASLTSDHGDTVPAESYQVVATPVDGTVKTLTGTLPKVPSTLYPSSTWLDDDGVPKQLAFGWFGSTGGYTDVHEISDVRVQTFDPDLPDVPARPTAVAGLRQAAVSWVAPSGNGAPITGYVITPYLAGEAQPPVKVDPAATTRVVNGLTAGGSYTFTVAAVSSRGTSEASPASGAVVPYAELGAPTITSVQAQDASAVLSWTAPSDTGGSAVTGYVVTPYVGSVAQAPQTFTGDATTRTVTGLTPGTAYTFRVAPQNASGSTALYRINAGGPAVAATDGGPDWADDTAASSPYRNSGSSTYGVSSPVTLDGTVPSGTPTTLFSDERWDPGSKGDGGEMAWQFPVSAGAAVKVRLYFAERSYPDEPGARVFDVNIDGTPVLDHFSPGIGAGGGHVGTMRECSTTSDGTVDIDFTHEVENPKIDAIEIIQTGVATTGPSSAASTEVTPSTAPSLSFPAPPAGQVGVAYSDQLTVTGGTSPFTWSVSSGSLPDGLSLGADTGLLSGTPTTAGTSTFTVRAVDDSDQSATQPVTLVIAPEAPDAPARPTAVAGLSSAAVTWAVPSGNGAPITGYVITPYLAGAAQTPVTVDPAATTRVLNGLTAGGSYTFTVAAVSSRGTSEPSPASRAVVPYALNAPTITSVQAQDSSAVLSWSAPTSTGGSAVTGYVVTPYIGSVAQAPQTFSGTATTRTVTGLTPGTAYTFQVAAQNDSGSTVLYRINGAGPAVAATDGGPVWESDPDSSPYRDGGAAAASNPSAVLDSTVPPGTPLALFDTERYGNTSWHFPVASGAPVQVRLYFVNRYGGTSSVGSRVFDVALDGNRVLDHFDIVAGAGADQTATMREFALTSDGTVNVDLTYEVQNPLINAIEILQTGVATTGPSSTASTPVTPNDSPALSFEAPSRGQVGVIYQDQLTVTGGTSPFTWSTSDGDLPDGLRLDASTGLLSGTPTVAGTFTMTVEVVDDSGQRATRPVTLVINPPAPDAPARPTVTAGLGQATVSWEAPSGNGAAITGYVITPYLSGVAQAPLRVDPAATTRVVNGLTAGGSYTFTVAALSAQGTSVQSRASGVVVPYAPLGAPTITSVQAQDSSAVLSWSAPDDTGGSPVTGYVVTPYVGEVAQAPQVFSGAATTRTVTGLTPGTAYTFRVAAQNDSGSTSLYRINGAGPTVAATDGGPDWQSDPDSSPYRDGGAAASSNPSAALDSTIPPGTPLALFDTERYASTSWHFPVTSGTPIEVRLYFANRYDGTTSVGDRVFDVALDGSRVLDHFDIVAGAGGSGIATMREFALTSDGTVNVDLTYEVQNPLINAIEILQTGVATTGPGSAPSGEVTPVDSPSLGFPAPPPGEVGVAYRDQLTVSGGMPSFIWSVPDGTLPDGLRLDPETGLLSGTPTTAGTSTFTVQVVDDSGQSSTQQVTLVVSAAITFTFSPQPGEVGVAYHQQPSVNGSVGPYAWAVSSGSLPVGLTLDPSTGLVSGTPTDAGTSDADLTVTDAIGGSATETVTFTVAALPSLTSTPPPAAQVAVAYTTSFTASGGTAPLVWSISAGSLPPGLTLDPGTGVLSGKPTTIATSSFTVTVTDAAGQTASRPVTLVVGPGPLVITTTADASPTAPGNKVTFTVTLTSTATTTFTDVTLTDPLGDPGGVLDDAAYDGDARATSGTVGYADQAVTWSGDVPAGGSVSITYSVTVSRPDVGDQVLTSTVTSSTSGTNCPTGGADPRCTAAVPVAGLLIRSSAEPSSVTPGSVVTFTVTVANTGKAVYTGASIEMNFAGVFAGARYNGDVRTSRGELVQRANGTVAWFLALDPGETAEATASFTVLDASATTGTDRVLRATFVSDAVGSSCPRGSTDPDCWTIVRVLIPAVTVTASADASSVVAGGTLGYTIRATNTGETDYSAVTLTDDLRPLLPYGVYAGGATATVGEVVDSDGALSWSGPLARGASVVVSFSVRVSVDTPDATVLTNRVVSSDAGSTCPPTSGDRRCSTVTSIAARTLTLTAVTPSFTLTGLPGSTVEQDGAVGMTVTTNNLGGYSVTMSSTKEALDGPGSADTIPVGRLSVRSGAGNPFVRVPGPSGTPVRVHTSTGPTSADGDRLRDDYQVEIPDVAAGTYSTELEYIATAQ